MSSKWLNMTCLEVSGECDDPRHILKPFLSGEFPRAERSGVHDTTKILVQVFCDNVHVRFRDSLYEIIYELELGRCGAC